MLQKIFKWALAAIVSIVVLACGKAPLTEDSQTSVESVMETAVKTSETSDTEETIVSAAQPKYYLSAAEDLNGKVNAKTAGLIVLLQDSKFYAVGERILSVSYSANQNIVGAVGAQGLANGGKTVTMNWASEDPVHRPVVEHAPKSAEFGLLCLPGDYTGKFIVTTSRYTYTFTKNFSLAAGANTSVTLDFANPDVQPTRKVGVLGDSISTFEGALCNEDYVPFYPAKDPNVAKGSANAVNCKEKTYWWRLIYDHMKHGQLDVNNSWSGTRVVHEMKSGRVTGNSIGAGFVDRAYNFVDPDIILIHGGTNDKVKTSEMGSNDWDYPIGQLNVNAYRSAYIQLIKMLQQRYEGVQIIIIVGDRLGHYVPDTEYDPDKDYARATIEIARHFGLPYVSFTDITIEKCAGSHPTSAGFDLMAQTIYNTCKDYLP